MNSPQEGATMAISRAQPLAGGRLATAEVRARGQVAMVLRELRRNRGAVVGLVVLLLLVLMAIFAPVAAPYDPVEVEARARFISPSTEHWMGTDKYGRDILSRVVYGARISLVIGFISVGIGIVSGVPLGLVAGWVGGWVNTLIMRLTDAMLALPGLLLALSIVAALGPSLTNAMIAVGVGTVPTYVRLVQSGVLSAREHVYVGAAKVSGCSPARIMFRHILPNVAAPVIVVSTLGMGSAILSASGLSFLGLGAQPPTPEWGATVADGRSFLVSAWWVSTFPSLAIMVTVLAINLCGDGLRDALDPRLRRR
jgi:peptide/nickel transport system permease protein